MRFFVIPVPSVLRGWSLDLPYDLFALFDLGLKKPDLDQDVPLGRVSRYQIAHGDIEVRPGSQHHPKSAAKKRALFTYASLTLARAHEFGHVDQLRRHGHPRYDWKLFQKGLLL